MCVLPVIVFPMLQLQVLQGCRAGSAGKRYGLEKDVYAT